MKRMRPINQMTLTELDDHIHELLKEKSRIERGIGLAHQEQDDMLWDIEADIASAQYEKKRRAQ